MAIFWRIRVQWLDKPEVEWLVELNEFEQVLTYLVKDVPDRMFKAGNPEVVTISKEEDTLERA